MSIAQINKYSRAQEMFFESGHQVKNLVARPVFLVWVYDATTDIKLTLLLLLVFVCVHGPMSNKSKFPYTF